jgi:hypothetical protein
MTAHAPFQTMPTFDREVGTGGYRSFAGMEDEVEPEADTETWRDDQMLPVGFPRRACAIDDDPEGESPHYPRVDRVADRPNRAPATRGSSKPCTTTEKITTPKQIVTT